MSIHVDPTLVAGFASEVRSHLPEIHQALKRFHGAADTSALTAARERLEGMRDASAMVGLESLGKMLDALLQGLEQVPPSESPETPLAVFDQYLAQLEDDGHSEIEPAKLLQELNLALSQPAPIPKSGDGDLPSPRSNSEPADVDPTVGEPSAATTSGSAQPAGNSLPLPGWVSRGEEGEAAQKASSSPFEVKGAKASGGPSAEVREIFAAEADEHAQVIARKFGALRPDVFQRETLAGLRRRVHNLKGSAALVRLDDLSQIAHVIEDLLDLLYEQQRGATRSELSSLEVAVDAMQALIYQGGQGVDVSSVLELFQAIKASSARAASTAQVSAGQGPLPEDGLTIQPTTEVEPASAAQPELVAATAAAPTDEKVSRATQVPKATESVDAGSPLEAEDSGERRRFVRVSVEALDEAVRLLVAVDAERHRLQALLASQNDYARELDLTDNRLNREVRALETELEVAALGAGHVPNPKVPKVTNDLPFDALEFDQYTELHERSRALIESTGDLESVRVGLGGDLVSMDHSIERLESVTLELRDRLLGLRLVPFSTLEPRLEGVVRQAARDRQRPARLVVDDRGVELDKDILDALVDPLDHLLRNAVAHGIESVAERRALGKDETAVIRLEARYAPRGVVIRVLDDGRGIDLEKLGQQALRRGLATAEELASWQPSKIRELIFEPGLTTADTVDRIAGRGVGLDVVRDRLRQLRGQLVVESNEGLGTTISLELPTSLAVQRVLLVQDQGHQLAVPSSGLERLERIAASRIEAMGDREVVRSGDTVYRVVRLASAAGLPPTRDALELKEDRLAILIRSAERSLALLVERIVDSREVVVQDLGRHLRQISGILGVTHTGTGHPVPILDPEVWLDDTSLAVPARARPAVAQAQRRQTVLVVDDSFSMRRYLSQLVGRFGFAGVEARDGRDALDVLASDDLTVSAFLLDLEMPRMDGFELMEVLRADPRFQDVPRIVLSSRSAEKHRQRAVASGADAYLVKPVLEAELQSSLHRLVAEGRS